MVEKTYWLLDEHLWGDSQTSSFFIEMANSVLLVCTVVLSCCLFINEAGLKNSNGHMGTILIEKIMDKYVVLLNTIMQL